MESESEWASLDEVVGALLRSVRPESYEKSNSDCQWPSNNNGSELEIGEMSIARLIVD